MSKRRCWTRNDPDRTLWTHGADLWSRDDQHHTRTLRKLYAQLAAVDAEMEATRDSNPCPEHAPTSWWIVRCRLREIEARRYVILRRIDRVQNHAE